MSIVATTNNNEPLALRICRELGQELWDRRARLVEVRPFFSVDDGVREAILRGKDIAARDGKPTMLVDLGDDPGSACPADSPAVLESLIRLGASDCALTIRDAAVVEAGVKAGVGAILTGLSVGASIDQRFYKPVEVTGEVRLIDNGNCESVRPSVRPSFAKPRQKRCMYSSSSFHCHRACPCVCPTMLTQQRGLPACLPACPSCMPCTTYDRYGART